VAAALGAMINTKVPFSCALPLVRLEGLDRSFSSAQHPSVIFSFFPLAASIYTFHSSCQQLTSVVSSSSFQNGPSGAGCDCVSRRPTKWYEEPRVPIPSCPSTSYCLLRISAPCRLSIDRIDGFASPLTQSHVDTHATFTEYSYSYTYAYLTYTTNIQETSPSRPCSRPLALTPWAS
jgi:hypothetical protein